MHILEEHINERLQIKYIRRIACGQELRVTKRIKREHITQFIINRRGTMKTIKQNFSSNGRMLFFYEMGRFLGGIYIE